MKRNFREMLEGQWSFGNFVCVGLDSEFSKIPHSASQRKGDDYDIGGTILNFNRQIIEATRDIVCAYKPNLAFYAQEGAEGILTLKRTVEYINTAVPDVPVILDAKYADIGNTNNGYAHFAFEYLRCDAVTVHPYLGSEALQPFLKLADKGIFVLCRTSNPGAGEFQDWDISGDGIPGGYMPLYKYVAHRVSTEWNKNSNCGLVAGATYPEELREVRVIAEDIPILIPGVGKQGGDLEKAVRAGKTKQRKGMIFNNSSGAIFASNGPDFAAACRSVVEKNRNDINNYR